MSTYEARLAALREQLKADRLDGFVVPLTDEHMSEYVGSYAQRLAWLTGFQGSAGSAVVLPEEAAIFVDGRYTLQVRDQVDGSHWSYQSVPETSIADWLKAHAPDGGRIGYDPWLHTKDWVAKAQRGAGGQGRRAGRGPPQPDRRGLGRPARALAGRGSIVHPDDYAGKSSAAKRQEMADWLKEQKADAAVLAALDSIAWTFNVRGKDVEHTPVALSFALVHDDGTADLFVASEKIGDDVRQHLGNGVRVHERARFRAGARGARRQDRGGRSRSGRWRRSSRRWRRPAPRSIAKRDPSILPKAIKNEVEIAGHRAAQARDGARSVALPPLAFGRGAQGRRRRARARPRSCRQFRQAVRRPSRPQLRHHLRRRPQRRDRPLPGQRGDQPADRDGLDLPGRFGRPISGRHHRRDPHRRDRHADGGDEATASPASSRAISRSPAPASRKARAAPSSTASRASSCGRPGSITPTAPATASAASSPVHEGPQRISPVGSAPGGRRRAAQGRHVPLQRARLLQDRRIRHPRRESGAGRAGRGRGRREEAARLRDAHLRADRPQSDRGRRCCPPDGAATGSTIIMPRCWRIVGPQLDGEAKAWLEAGCAPL